MKKTLRAGITILSIITIITVILFALEGTNQTLLIYMGTKMAKLFKIIILTVIIILLLAFIAVFIGVSKQEKLKEKMKIAKEMKTNVSFTGNVWNEDKFKALENELEESKYEIPELSPEITNIIKQFRNIERKKSRLIDLININEIELPNVKQTLNETEVTIYKNASKALNRLIVWDVEEAQNPSAREVYQEHKEYIHKVIDYNNSILKNCEELLSQTSNYINHKHDGLQDDQTNINSMKSALKTLTQLNQETNDFNLK